MTEQIRQAMEECAEDPAAGERRLRALMERGGNRFVQASLGLVETDRDSPGYPLPMTLLARSDQIVNRLCDPEAFSKEASIDLARKLVLFDPKLDTRLVRLLPGRDRTLTSPANCATIERVLELLEVVSFCARIVPPLARLLGDPNPPLAGESCALARPAGAKLPPDRDLPAAGRPPRPGQCDRIALVCRECFLDRRAPVGRER